MSRPSFVNSLLPHSRLLFPYNTRNVLCCLISTFRVGEMGRNTSGKTRALAFYFQFADALLAGYQSLRVAFSNTPIIPHRYNVKCDDIPSSRSKAFVSTNENQPRFRYPGDYSLTVASSLISAVNTERFRYYTHTHIVF